MSLLDRTVTVKQIVDAALLSVWYAEFWANGAGNDQMPEDKRNEQRLAFLSQGQAYVFFLYSEVGLSDRLEDYRGLKVPRSWIPYFKGRESEYKHPIISRRPEG